MNGYIVDNDDRVSHFTNRVAYYRPGSAPFGPLRYVDDPTVPINRDMVPLSIYMGGM